jgi:hypothetical protein
MFRGHDVASGKNPLGFQPVTCHLEPEPCRSSAACPRATGYSALSRSPSHCHVVVLNSDRSTIVDAEIMEQLESEELPWCYEPVGRQHVGV